MLMTEGGALFCVFSIYHTNSDDDGPYLADGRMIDANGDDVLLGSL